MINSVLQPLAGLTVLVTRAQHQAQPIMDRLRALGAEPVSMPMIDILPPESWEALDQALSQITDYDWVVFASTNSVNSFWHRLPKSTEHQSNSEKLKFAAIGPSTRAAVEKHGAQVTYQAEEYVAEGFIAGFPEIKDLSGKRILWPKTNIGRLLIVEQLRKAGATVDVVQCYRTALPRNADTIAVRLLELLQRRRIDVVLLASAQTATNLRAILNLVARELEIRELIAHTLLLAIGPETAQAAKTHLFKCDLQAAEYTIDGMIDTLLKRYS